MPTIQIFFKKGEETIRYFDNSLTGWKFDEGFYLVPLLRSINKRSIDSYEVKVKFNQKSFYQSIEFKIGVYSIENNTGGSLDTRLPFKLTPNKNSIFSIPLTYSNKPNKNSKSKKIQCGIEVNSCHGNIKKFEIFSSSKEKSNKNLKVLTVNDLGFDTTSAFRKFSVLENTNSLRIEFSAS